jgi:hypothetical protein
VEHGPLELIADLVEGVDHPSDVGHGHTTDALEKIGDVVRLCWQEHEYYRPYWSKGSRQRLYHGKSNRGARLSWALISK